MSVVGPLLGLLGFVALTAGTAIFVAAEFSLTALERSTVESRARDGDRRSRLVLDAHRTLSFQLSAAQLGITITTLLTGYIAEPVLAQFMMPLLTGLGVGESAATWWSLAAALFIATSLSMVFGELLPKNIAIAHPWATARAAAPLQMVFAIVFRWLINGLNGSANWMVRRLGVEPTEELRSARSPSELGALVRSSAESGSLDQATATLVGRSLAFGDRTAEDLMTPRSTITQLDVDDTIADLIATAVETGFSRFPVVDGDLDDTVGVAHVKDALLVPAAERSTTSVRTLARTVPIVPASLDGDDVLERIRTDGMQIALVADEYGGTAGLVTMEDLIEEIVGDVRDEHDRGSVDVERTEEGWLCSGLLRIDEIDSATGYHAPEGDYETIGGLVLELLGRIPDPGDWARLPDHSGDIETTVGSGWLARVEAMDGRRIDRVHLISMPPYLIDRMERQRDRLETDEGPRAADSDQPEEAPLPPVDLSHRQVKR